MERQQPANHQQQGQRARECDVGIFDLDPTWTESSTRVAYLAYSLTRPSPPRVPTDWGRVKRATKYRNTPVHTGQEDGGAVDIHTRFWNGGREVVCVAK